MRPLRSFYAFFNVIPRIRLRQQITSIGRISSYQRLVAVSIRSKPDPVEVFVLRVCNLTSLSFLPVCRKME